MSGSSTNDADRTDHQHASNPLFARTRRALSRLFGGTRRGTIAMLAGGALLARARRTSGRLRTALSALAGIALVGYGIRERLAGGTRGAADGPPADRLEDRTGAADDGSQGTEAMRSESHTGTNPRDVSQDPDIDTETEADDGSVQFTTDQDASPRSRPHRDDPEADRDTRRESSEGEDEPVEVDISESAMADEPNEAAGPDPTQAYPSQVEDTEPDPSPEADTSHVEADESTTDGTDEDTAGDGDAAGDDGTGEDVSTEDRYEGERGPEGTVETEDEVDRDPDETDRDE